MLPKPADRRPAAPSEEGANSAPPGGVGGLPRATASVAPENARPKCAVNIAVNVLRLSPAVAAARQTPFAPRMPGRKSKKIFNPRKQREGAGFIIRRSIGSSDVTTQETDPFLMLDELPLHTYAPGEFPGAPWHPHRGMDTVMYVKQGTCGHEDSMGNKGVLKDGDCQWMTAASGIEHNEGTGHPGGPLHGFQCWINLPSANKMDPPAYNDMSAASIPSFEPAPGVKAKVIVGEVGEVKSLIKPVLKVQYIDFMVGPKASYEHMLAAEYETCIVHVYRGAGVFGADGREAKEGQCLLFASGDSLSFSASDEGVDFLLLAGVPLKEPVVWHGPFVMNTQAQMCVPLLAPCSTIMSLSYADCFQPGADTSVSWPHVSFIPRCEQ